MQPLDTQCLAVPTLTQQLLGVVIQFQPRIQKGIAAKFAVLTEIPSIVEIGTRLDIFPIINVCPCGKYYAVCRLV